MNEDPDFDAEFFGVDPNNTTTETAVIPYVPPAKDRFFGASERRFSEEQKAKLEQTIDPDELDILPTGEVYASQVRYRRILNDAFGPGGWALIPQGAFFQEGNSLCREYSLFAEGRFVSCAIGEADFQPNNPRYSKATAAESLKSNALTRCCKDLLIASECWDKRANEEWIAKYAVMVWCQGVARDNKGKKKKLWRRKDGKRFDYPWREDDSAAPPPEPEDESQEPETEAEPVVTDNRNEKWLRAAETEKKRLGKEKYYEVLGAAGFSDAHEVLDRETQKKIFMAWTGIK